MNFMDPNGGLIPSLTLLEAEKKGHHDKKHVWDHCDPQEWTQHNRYGALALHSEKFKMNWNGISILSENKSNLLLVRNAFSILLHYKCSGDIRKASGFVITMEPIGFVVTKEVDVFLLRVHVNSV